MPPTARRLVGLAAVCRTLTKLGLPRKKVAPRLRARHAAGEGAARRLPTGDARDLSRFEFVDESGVNLALTRLFVRAPRAERVPDAVPQNYGENVTLLGSRSASGVEALMTVNGATSGEVFLAFVREVLSPALREGDVLIWDNLGAHRSEAVEARGARLIFLPPYSPDYNPIEWCWSKIKRSYARRRRARARRSKQPSGRRSQSPQRLMPAHGSSTAATR